jgi:GNAT superfamily N-acetyltransferase
VTPSTPQTPTITTRRAAREDIDILLCNVQAGFDSYVDFAGPGWRPPDAFADRTGGAELLGKPSTWGLIALAGGDAVGHIAFCPARHRIDRTAIPGLGHLWQLFVLPAWWGRGVAPLLHEAAVCELHARGFVAIRLYTPSEHVRARRFYERRGWQLTGEEWNENLSLMLVEYRRPLP